MPARAPRWIAAFSIAAFLALAFGDIISTSPIYDEPTHLAAGWSYLKTGDFRLNPEHPPLVKSIAALPMMAILGAGVLVITYVPWLTTGLLEEGNQRFYKRAGYRLVPGEPTYPGAVDLTKRRR